MNGNYHRFYALLSRLQGADKEALVLSFTDGRTTHLREMTPEEYKALCAALEEQTGWRDALRRRRSQCLRLMQRMGIDTTSWPRIDAFCSDPRIAGRAFARLGVKDLDALQVKLRAIMSHGGLRPAPSPPSCTYVAVPLAAIGRA